MTCQAQYESGGASLFCGAPATFETADRGRVPLCWKCGAAIARDGIDVEPMNQTDPGKETR